MKTPAGVTDGTCTLPFKDYIMAFQKTFERNNGSRVKIEPVLEVDSFYNEAYRWSYIVYYAAPGQEKFEDVTAEHLQGNSYTTEREIRECQLGLWEMLKPVE